MTALAYAKERGMSVADASDLLSSCIDSHYIGERKEGTTTWLWVNNKEGRAFLPLFSGLAIGEFRILGPLWTFLGGAAAAIAIVAAVKL
jgi:hypothetical protein